MDSRELIFSKLENFIRKYYTNELLRGIIFFVGLGLLYLFATSFIEYLLWLKPMARTFLFISFVSVQVFLLVRFIVFPICKLFKFQKGINYDDASKIIGNHFANVNDKLINFLQLSSDNNKSELLLASIDQKAQSLQPVPFSNAIDFNKNKKYLPLAVLPFVFFIFLFFSGKQRYITDSMNRVVNYKTEYLPPAPFYFKVLNNNLQTQQKKDFLLKISTVGNIRPEKVMILIGNESYFMSNNQAGQFVFKFEEPLEDINFIIQANDVVSKNMTLNVVPVPAIANFEMVLNFPNYINKPTEIVKGGGNAIVPEGTNIMWKIATVATKSIELTESNKQYQFAASKNVFILSKNIFQNTVYQIVTSNSDVKNFEKLSYNINVIKDQFPTIKVTKAADSLKGEKDYTLGQISDDYGFSKLNIVFFPKSNPQSVKKAIIPISKGGFDQFVFAFPGMLPIQDGVAYEYYFEVFDNDVLHNFKSTISSEFSYRESTQDEKQNENLLQQNQNINSLEKSLNSQDKQMAELDKLQKTNKEKNNLDYKDQQKIDDFLKRQKQADEKMQDFSKKIKENLEQFKPEEKDAKKDLLKERLDKAAKDLQKNQKLLDELKELNKKLEQDELSEKIENFQQKSKNQSKTLEQLVELTKRYYVEKKAEQLQKKFDKLGDKQDALSENQEKNNIDEQKEINAEFDKIKKELDDLQKENKELKKPLGIPQDKEAEKSIDTDLQKASDELQKKQEDKAKPKQKSAAKKMKQMASKMSSSMAGGEKEELEEDIAVMRQILDNLLAFSFSEEVLIKKFKSINNTSSAFSKHLKTQQDLKYQFKHVDDSLFAMSLRNPKISENITNEIGKVYYNIDKSIKYFTDANLASGASSQQFALTSANNLANFLADILTNMQMSMSGMGSGSGKPKPGSGQGGGMQLPDIIKKQDVLADKMKNGKKPGQKPGDGKEGKDGKEGQEGKEGKDGNSGKDGKSGKGNKPGEGGSGNGEGSKSQDGEGDAKAVLDILKEQKQLRDALEKELEKNGFGPAGQSALEQMKQIEKQFINKGFSNDAIQKALNLKYELLKLEKAIQEQNQDTKRQSSVNKKEFNNSANPLPQKLQEYLNSIEILNKQTLPLRSNFNRKVQEYFKAND